MILNHPIRISTLKLVATIIFLFSTSVFATERCTKEDSIAAASIHFYIESWAGMQELYKHYAHCDDGEAAEGFSDAVGRLLIKSWRRLPELAKLSQANPGFLKFVLRHIDSTLLPEDLARIEFKANHQCTRSQNTLCKKIAKEAKDARSEQKTPF